MKDNFTDTEIKILLSQMVSMADILKEAGHPVRTTGSMYCPFHLNLNSPAAKFFPGTNNLYCFSEHHLYNVHEAITLLGIDYREYFYQLWNTSTDEQKTKYLNQMGEVQAYEPQLKFKPSLIKFKNEEISYSQLCEDIKFYTDQHKEILSLLYSISREINETYISSDDYTYLCCLANLPHIKQLTSGEIINKKLSDYRYISNFIKLHTNVILIFNMYKDEPIGCTIRSQNSHDFMDVGNMGGMFYNLCNMSPDFQYGDPITLVEGPKDCETYKYLFKNPNCLAMMTVNTTKSQLEVLKYLTSSIILANDNDIHGQESQQHFIRQNKKKFKINIITHPDNIKDFGDLIPLIRTNKETAKQYITRYNIQINTFV